MVRIIIPALTLLAMTQPPCGAQDSAPMAPWEQPTPPDGFLNNYMPLRSYADTTLTRLGLIASHIVSPHRAKSMMYARMVPYYQGVDTPSFSPDVLSQLTAENRALIGEISSDGRYLFALVPDASQCTLNGLVFDDEYAKQCWKWALSELSFEDARTAGLSVFVIDEDVHLPAEVSQHVLVDIVDLVDWQRHMGRPIGFDPFASVREPLPNDVNDMDWRRIPGGVGGP